MLRFQIQLYLARLKLGFPFWQLIESNKIHLWNIYCRYGEVIQQNSWGSSQMRKKPSSPSQPPIIPTLHKSMQLRMGSPLMRSSLRRSSARSLLDGMRSMTQCWVLFVKFPQNLFFQIMYYQIKHQRTKNDFVSCFVFPPLTQILRDLASRNICC